MLCSLERLQPLTKHPPAMGQAFDGPARPKFPKPQPKRWGFLVSHISWPLPNRLSSKLDKLQRSVCSDHDHGARTRWHRLSRLHCRRGTSAWTTRYCVPLHWLQGYKLRRSQHQEQCNAPSSLDLPLAGKRQSMHCIQLHKRCRHQCILCKWKKLFALVSP